MTSPILTTERLVLRAHRPEDTAAMQEYLGDRAVADTTINLPHPYPEGTAAAWVATIAGDDTQVQLAITLLTDGKLIGGIGLKKIDARHRSAELGYWVGRRYWNQGYGTEAARAFIRYGFERLILNRIYATCMTRNLASGRVLEKVGMTREGILRQHYERWGAFEDMETWAILADGRKTEGVNPTP